MRTNKKYILAIDQGTTGSRAFIFDNQGRVIAKSYKEFKQYFPRAGWVEHDAAEIWSSCESVIKGALKKAKLRASHIGAIGITNQRETTVVWHRKTGKPLARAIVWQCRRTSEFCNTLKKRGHEKQFKNKTGLVLDPYFSGTKMRWFLDNVKGLREKAKRGDVCFGTIDSWLIYKLTAGREHTTDMTNASRTLLFNIKTKKWDAALCRILGVPENTLPRVQASGSVFGQATLGRDKTPIPITGVLGDQQAALFGQGCFKAGTMKNTYGTGCFVVLNTGKKFVASKYGLLTTLASDENGKPVYALEGSIFIAGAVVQWLRDELKVFKDSAKSEDFIKGVKDTNGVYFVPAFAGLGAPHWDSNARGIISGLTRGANMQHIVRAALESIAYQTKDVVEVMQKELKSKITTLKVDGGACQNNFLMQFQADVLGAKVVRPVNVDTTALGAALLAGKVAGLLKGVVNINGIEKTFISKMALKDRQRLLKEWNEAVVKARA